MDIWIAGPASLLSALSPGLDTLVSLFSKTLRREEVLWRRINIHGAMTWAMIWVPLQSNSLAALQSCFHAQSPGLTIFWP